MSFTAEEISLIAYSLGVYRASAQLGHAAMPAGGVVAIDGLCHKLARYPVRELEEGYRGIGERRGGCLCPTCREIVEGQLRALIERVPVEHRAGLIACVERSLVDVEGLS